MTNKIALVTCYFQPNYGSQLQAFATQKFFDDIHVPNETIMIDGLKGEINKDNFNIFICLRDKASNTLMKITTHIITWYNN